MGSVSEIIGHIYEMVSPPYPEIGNLPLYVLLAVMIWGMLTKLINWRKTHRDLKNERLANRKTDRNRRDR